MPQSQPAVEGWFTTTGEPALLGTRCRECGTYHFPAETFFCRNPACSSSDLEPSELSRKGRVWSWSMNHYAAPPPFPQTEPFEPYGVAAVELAKERMIVLGMLARDVDASALSIGKEVELVVEPLYTDDDGEHLVWKWRPV
jgi:uncharacterized OB-fold protein